MNGRRPVIIVNFKTYLEATGDRGVDLARKIESTCNSFKVSAAVAPQFSDIASVARQVKLPVLAQHIDATTAGAFTGHVLAECVKEAGAKGTLINHSERALTLTEIEKAIDRARKLGLMSVACASSARLSAAIAVAEPDMVAIEPPELIGTGRAVSKERPEIVSDTIKKIRGVNDEVTVLCGAGISTGEDVTAALKLGAQGVLVASAIVKAEQPVEILKEFCEAFIR